VEDCDLNYLFLECFYLGVPLIHNSPMLKNYGYYYPKFDISKGVEHLRKIFLNGHNKKVYIKRHLPLIEKYSLNNKFSRDWVHNQLTHQLNADWI
jgi:hypothetical protein